MVVGIWGRTGGGGGGKSINTFPSYPLTTLKAL